MPPHKSYDLGFQMGDKRQEGGNLSVELERQVNAEQRFDKTQRRWEFVFNRKVNNMEAKRECMK